MTRNEEVYEFAIDRGQTMKMANDLFPLFLNDAKRCTLRKGERDIKLGHLFFISTDPISKEEYGDWHLTRGCEVYRDNEGVFFGQSVDVYEVVIKRFCEFTNEELAQEGFDNRIQALELMRRFYPDLDMQTPMTMIYFEVC